MAKSMSPKKLLKEIEKYSYLLGICIRQDANWYFHYGFLAALKMIAREMNLDYNDAEDRGAKRATEFLKQEAEKPRVHERLYG